MLSESMRIDVPGTQVEGDLVLPDGARGIVVFAHGSGSSRHSPRNRFVASKLQERALGTLLMDLLTADEERVDMQTRELRFDIALLAERLIAAIDRLEPDLPIGTFGASTGAAAALITAADRPDRVHAVVSRGGRSDLADDALPRVRADTLLIVGERDEQVLDLNRRAAARLSAPWKLEIVPRATHLFEEPGALEDVARLAGDWFCAHLTGGSR